MFTKLACVSLTTISTVLLAAPAMCGDLMTTVEFRLSRQGRIEIAVQVNGKLVNVVKVLAGSDEATVKAAALADEKVKARLEGKTVVKVIVVPDKIVNIVVK